MWEFLRKRLVGVATTVTMVGTIVGGAIAVESRYAKAADVADMKRQQVLIYQNLQQEQRIIMDDFHRHELEDRIFELRLKPNPSPAERALIQRYQDQMQELNSRINTRRQQIVPVQ